MARIISLNLECEYCGWKFRSLEAKKVVRCPKCNTVQEVDKIRPERIGTAFLPLE